MSGDSGDDAVLKAALRELDGVFARTEASWRDQAREDFMRDHLDAIHRRAREAVRSIQQVHSLMRQAIDQCQ